jgi:flavin reductase (DIM6/NTAB) family NADH-FMN oxidoreductase RutF
MPQTDNEVRLSADDFRFAFRAHPAGVAIVTADDGSGPVAMTVSSVASVSINPPTLVFSASSVSSSTPTITSADTVVVHLLSADDVDLAKLGAKKGADRFADDVAWDRLPTGEPYYPGAHWLRGKVTQRVEVNGATLIIVEALEGKTRDDISEAMPKPLVYHGRRWHVLGERSAFPERVSAFSTVYGRDE